ncbi:LysR family transcriptional regulator [Nonomuraea bangladeshensis]|uniref:LysR family transcriptional regulator n=1 Tax=Nonomuraea bangladeshensis TaxID=404385 RepID=A0ABV3H585_9ACTN
MELRHLRYFLAVVDHGTTARAAEAALVAQPSLSRQLRRLEADLKLALFDHSGGRLRLTSAGRQFVPIARDLLARAAAAQEAARALGTGQVSRITIAAPVTTIADVIAPFIATTGGHDAMITVQEVLPADAYDALWRGADVAISSAPPPLHLAGGAVARLPVLAYPPPGHPWEGRARVGIAELAEQPLLLLTAEHGTRRLFDHAVLRAGVRYATAFETSIPQIAQALAAAGRGVAVVSDDPRYGLHPVSVDGTDGPISISLFAGWSAGHYAAATIAPLVERLSSYCVDRYGAEAAP